MTTWITQREAAEILGVGQSAVARMARRGELTPREVPKNHPTLDLLEVEALRDRRTKATEDLAGRREAEKHGSREPPDDEHEWLPVADAAALIGITRQALNVRCRKDTMPSVMKGGWRWIRRDHLEMVERAHAVARGEEPPAWTWSW